MLRVLSLSLLVFSCGSDPVSGTDSGGGGTNGSGGTSGSRTCTEGPTNTDVCDDGPGFAESAPLVDSGSVRATVVDAEGVPVADLMVFICGTRVCSMPEYTDADGAVTIASPEPMEKPAFKFGDGLEVGRFAALLSESSNEVDLGTVGTPRLPAPGACLSPGATAESGGVRITLAGDARVEVLPIDYPEEADRTFRAAELPVGLAAPGLDDGAGLDAIFALAPTAVVCPPALLELPNTPGYAVGTEVDILVHGTDVDEGFAPYGRWQPVAVGRVDASGKRIETIEGGLPVIANVAVRAR